MTRRCNKCILPQSFPDIRFDKCGICNYCREYEPIRYLGEGALSELLDKYRNKGRKYDCLVPVSGGKDSAFALSKLKDVYRMRVLAFHYDSGFVSEQAVDNLKRMVQVLDVDLLTVRSSRSLQEKLLKKSIVTWCRNPDLIPLLCIGCQNAIEGGAFRVAKAEGIPLIVQGGSLLEESLFKRKVTTYHSSRFVHTLLKFIKDPLYYPTLLPDYLRSNLEFPPVNTRKTTRSIVDFHGVHFIHFFDYTGYDEQKILSTVKDRLGWKREKETGSTWHIDCEVHALVDHIFQRRLGFTEKDEYYGRMIREGIIDRQEALRRIDEEKRNAIHVRKVIDRLFHKLELFGSERDYIMSL